jgi:hypothetical protein
MIPVSFEKNHFVQCKMSTRHASRVSNTALISSVYDEMDVDCPYASCINRKPIPSVFDNQTNQLRQSITKKKRNAKMKIANKNKPQTQAMNEPGQHILAR